MSQEFSDLPQLIRFIATTPGSGSKAFCRLGLLHQQAALLVALLVESKALHIELLIDSDAVRHITKQHGPARSLSEATRGQIPIVEADFLALADWLPLVSEVSSGETKKGKPLRIELAYSTELGTTIAILEWRPGRQQLALVTMYKKRPAA